jgi:hypothetical protein
MPTCSEIRTSPGKELTVPDDTAVRKAATPTARDDNELAATAYLTGDPGGPGPVVDEDTKPERTKAMNPRVRQATARLLLRAGRAVALFLTGMPPEPRRTRTRPTPGSALPEPKARQQPDEALLILTGRPPKRQLSQPPGRENVGPVRGVARARSTRRRTHDRLTSTAARTSDGHQLPEPENPRSGRRSAVLGDQETESSPRA